MRFILFISLFILLGCEKQEVISYQSRAIIKNVHCYDNFLNGVGCVTSARYINGPYKGQTCTNNKMIGDVGDTILVSITRYSSDYVSCQMR